MSGGNSLRKAFDYPAIQDSRVIAEIGRGLHIPALTAEAKHNEQNPGRAETKASVNALLWYLGGEAGSAFGGGGGDAAGSVPSTAGMISGGAGSMTGAAGDESAGLAMNALSNGAGPYASAASQAAGATGGLLAGGGSEMTAAQLQQLAMQDMTDTGLLGSGSPTVSANNMLQMTQNAPVTDLSVQAQAQPLRAIQDYAARYAGGVRNLGSDAYNGARNIFSHAAGVPAEQSAAPVYDQSVNALRTGTGSGAKNLAMQMGLKMLEPPGRPAPPMGMPAPQGQQGPLTNPYQNNPYGPGGNSLGLSEDQKQKLRAMGYQIP